MTASQILSDCNTSLCEVCDKIETYFFEAHSFKCDGPDKSVAHVTSLDEEGVLSMEEEEMLEFWVNTRKVLFARL
jgi:hypothetical protein